MNILVHIFQYYPLINESNPQINFFQVQVATLKVLKMALSEKKKKKISNSHKHLATPEITQGGNHIIFVQTREKCYSGCTEDKGNSQNEPVSSTARETLLRKGKLWSFLQWKFSPVWDE